MKYFIIYSVLFLSLTNLPAQQLENIISTFDGERVTVTYDLKSSNADQRYTIIVFGSHDNYNRELAVAGEAGKNIAPGTGKKIVWEAKKHLPSEFNADVQIKIMATPEGAPVPTYAFENMLHASYKSGRRKVVQWTGGKPTDKLDLQLFQGNTRTQIIASGIQNTGNHDWKIPKDLKGKNYSLKLVASGSAEAKAESESFKIKSKPSAALILIPVFVLGGGAAYMLSGAEIGD